ncbi:MAG: hypothetical protein PWQ42_659 [Sulfurospirillum sp.]|jgi:pimeloyl-ACP methyl ester carboxylesterase|nr:hypothetical protein [Sulfurospirillum sp.]
MALKEIVYDGEVYQLSYEILNPTCKDDIVFLHGWGSNKEIMKNAFQNEFDGFRQVYIDLPGFGNSSIVKVIETRDYANIINTFLESLHVQKNIILGHSFGGKVATLLQPQYLVLLSSAGILVPKSLQIRLKIKIFKLFKNILPKSWFKFFASKDVSGMSQLMYEVLKRVVDEDFTSIFSNVKSKTLLFWGEKDSATPLHSGHKIHSLIEKSEFFHYDGDHFFFTKFSKQISKIIKERVK